MYVVYTDFMAGSPGETCVRVCFFGDSFTHGVGDQDGLGWRGRVANGLLKELPDLTAYDLGIRRDTSADILRRWEAEAQARLPPGFRHRLAFCFGTNDCADDGTGRARVALGETIGNAHDILSRSAACAPTIMIGPPPILDDSAADRRIAAAERELRAVAEACEVPFFPVFELLRGAPAWTLGAARGDGTHPDAAGYEFLAGCIREWPAFRGWAGSDR